MAFKKYEMLGSHSGDYKYYCFLGCVAVVWYMIAKRFLETFCIPLQGRALLWTRRHHIPQKRSVELHDVIPEDTSPHRRTHSLCSTFPRKFRDFSADIGVKPLQADNITTQSFKLASIQSLKPCVSQAKCNAEHAQHFERPNVISHLTADTWHNIKSWEALIVHSAFMIMDHKHRDIYRISLGS
jgi:hypothetical protein